MKQGKTLFRKIAPYVLLAGVLFLFFWPVWLLGYSMPRGGGDLWGQLEPVWSYIARNIRKGSFALWSTQMMAGDPIVGEAQYGLFNPLNWWLFLLGDFPRWVVLLRGILPLWLAGAGLYTYTRRSDLWRLSDSAALSGAVAYMLCDAFLIHLGHPHFNDTMAWLPWSLLAIDAVFRLRKVVWWTSLPVAAMVLAGHMQAALFGVFAIVLYTLVRLIGLQPENGRWLPTAGRILGSLAIVALCSIALTMPSILPGLERYPYTERAILQLDPNATGYQWNARMWIDLIAPDFHGRGIAGYWASWARVEGGYAGAVALLLAFVGITTDIVTQGPERRQHRIRAWFLILLGVFVVLFGLGHSGPIYPLLTDIDMVVRVGKTARVMFLLSFVIALGAAAGIQTLNTLKRTSRASVCAIMLLLAIMLVVTTPQVLLDVPQDRQQQSRSALYLAAGISTITALLVALYPKTKQISRTALFLLLVGELIITGTWVEVEPAGSNEASPAVQYLQSDPHWYRVDVDSKARGLLSPAVVLSYDFDVPQGSGNPMELFSYNQYYWAVPTKGSPAYQVLGAKYIIAPSGAMPGGEGIWPVFTDDPLVDVHLNTNALPRVWLIYDTIPVTSIEEANNIVFNPTFQPGMNATVENGPDLDGTGEGILELRRYDANRVEVFVKTDREVLLVLSDMHYPGWKASVDGESSDILKTDAIFRGVVVPAGEHLVVMKYRPSSVQLGLGLAAIGVLVMLISFVRGRKRRLQENANVR